MNILSLPQTTVTTILEPAPTTSFAVAFIDYLLGQEHYIHRLGLDACTTPAQRRGWLDGMHYSSLPENADPEMWEGERRALYAAHGVKMNGVWR